MTVAPSTRVTVQWLEAQLERLLSTAGASPENAALTARLLADAELCGVRTHGALLVQFYAARLRAGSIDGAAQPVVLRDFGAIAALDGCDGLGHPLAVHAMRLAVDKAKSFGIGAVTVINSTHFGAASHYAEQAAAAGLIGIAAANTRPLLPAPGGAEPVIGNNPLAVAAPRAGGDPIVVDLAMSQVALGNVRLALAAGTAIPEGWAADADGVPTTDPAAALAGMLLPAAGAKGFGLAVMVELLTSVLGGGGVTSEVRGLAQPLGEPYGSTSFLLAIDPGAFGDGFSERLERLASRIESSPARVGAPPVRLPGARRAAGRAGAPWLTLPDERMSELTALAQELGLTLDPVPVATV